MKAPMPASIFTLVLLASTAWTGLAAAQSLTVTNIVTTGSDGFELRVPTVEAVDANLDEAAIRALFSEDFATTAAALAGLDATAIRIPEITVAYDLPDGTGNVERAEVTYRGLELTGVRSGVADRAVVSATEITGGTDSAVITLGTMSTDLFDIGGILGFYGLNPGQSGAEMKPIYENLTLAGGSVTGDGISCTIGGASAESFRARPLKGTFADLMQASSELEQAEAEGTEPPQQAIATVIDFYADFLTALESTPTLFEGFTCEGTDEDGKSLMIAAGPGSMGGFSPGIYPGFGIDNVVVEADDGSFRLGSFTWKQMNIEDALENLSEAKGAIDEEWLTTYWRFLIPQAEGFSLADMVIDAPPPEDGGNRIQAAVGLLDLSLSDFRNGIPTIVESNASGVSFEVPEGDEGDALRSLGIERLNLGYGIAARWNRDAETISIDRMALSGDQLGNITISGTLANAGQQLFSERNEVIMAAAMGLTATSLTIEVENAGALSLLIASAAAEQNQEPKSFQVAMAGMAQALPLAMLGGTPEALELSTALGSFLNGAPRLKVTLTAVDPAGIGLAELMAASENPALLKDKVSIAAEAAGEPVPFVWPDVPPPSTGDGNPQEAVPSAGDDKNLGKN